MEATIKYDKHFGYVEFEDHYVLAEYTEKENKAVTSAEIPETFNGKPINVIGEAAFAGAVYPERVTLPDSVNSIEDSAFGSCSGLREIMWGNGLTGIECWAFRRCTALERLEIPEGVQIIDAYAFVECRSLKEAVLPHSLKYLYEESFGYCDNLENVVFLNKDVAVFDAFTGSTKLPVETLVYSLAHSCNIEEPFAWSEYGFDWDTALCDGVFAFATEHNSFENVEKKPLFTQLFNNSLMERYLPYMKKNDWIYRPEQVKGLAAALRYLLDRLGENFLSELENAQWFTELFPKLSDGLLDAFAEMGDVELTAWLLEYKKRNCGFDTEDNYEL